MKIKMYVAIQKLKLKNLYNMIWLKKMTYLAMTYNYLKTIFFKKLQLFEY